MIDELFAADIETAARDRIARPLPTSPAEPKFSAWKAITAIPRGVDAALSEVAATGADVLGGLRYMRDATPEQRRQIDRTGLPTESYSSPEGDQIRSFAREFRPDPQTAHAAEQVVYGFSRGATKVVGGALAAGPVGVIAAGLEEGITQADELRLQGVDLPTRAKAGAVQGAGLALAALPVVGQSAAATAGLYAIGGPGGFVAQQAMTRQILDGAGYDKIGAQFDPFDPVGLAVASLLPAAFAGYGMRQQKLQRAAASLPDLPPRADAAPAAEPAAPTPIPSRLSAVADAVRAYPTEAVDAARVVLLSERRAAANPGAACDMRAMDQHEAALTRAEDQIAAGEAVQVADVAPAPVPRVAPTETPEFRAWFGGSRVVTPEGAPMVLYHGTGADISQFQVSDRGEFGGGIYLTPDTSGASDYATYRGQGPANVLPVYVSIKNPAGAAEASQVASWKGEENARAELIRRGYDGVVDMRSGQVVAFYPEQIKSAIGNTGRFDPTSGSLTDSSYATWADQITAAIREMQAASKQADTPRPAGESQGAPNDALKQPEGAGRQDPSSDGARTNTSGPVNTSSASDARVAAVDLPTGYVLPPATSRPAAAVVSDAGRGAGVEAAGLTGPTGSTAEAVTERGLTVPVRYRLAEAGDLTTSHTNDLTPNPAFPAELQPRDRARAASAEQIGRIENAIRPELLGESVKASDGAPIVGPDAVVESGNARTIALRRAYDSGKADAYRAWLADNAERFGLTRADVEAMRQPVLVRERMGNVDRAEFARQANESAVAAMSPTEQALSDARRITDLSGLVTNEDGTINAGQSAEFVRQFIGQAVSPTERGAMLQANGQLSQAGMTRLRNAVFAKAYGDADILAMLTESTDANVRNILVGMLRAAPDVAKLADLAQAGARQDADIAGPLVEAVRLFSQLRSEGRTVQQFLAQGSMFGDGLAPEIQGMLEAIGMNARAPKRIAAMISSMVDAVDSLGDSRQMGMFGDAPTGSAAVAGAAERAVIDSRLAMAQEKFPALEVMMDGQDKPMPAAEFLAAAKAEADDLAADAPLMQMAATCAILNGAG